MKNRVEIRITRQAIMKTKKKKIEKSELIFKKKRERVKTIQMIG